MSDGLGSTGRLVTDTLGSRRLLDNPALARFVQNRPALISAGFIVLAGIVAFVGPFFTADPTLVDVVHRFANPSNARPLGADQLGRDILARVLGGARISMLVAVAGTAMAVFSAVPLGIVAGYFGGVIDTILNRLFDVLLTFPSILLAIPIVAVLGPSLGAVIIACGIGYIPRYGRLMRGLTLETRNREFVLSAAALGYSPLRIMARHVLPNIYLPLLVIAAGNMGRVAVTEAALSFLGVGIQPPAASLGNMISDGQPYLQTFPLLAVAPGLLLTAVSVGFTLIGDGLRDAFDLRDRGLGRIR